MAELTLRNYQRDAISSIYRAFQDNVSAPLIVMPTGSGKAPTLCTFIREALQQWPDQRILSLVHVRELVEQNLKTMLRIWPDAPLSIYSAGLKSKDLSGQIVFASIQSIYRRAFELQRVDLIVVDEAHLIPAGGDGMYRRLMTDLAEINGGAVPMVGFTATPFRMASGSLVEGDGRVFDRIAYEIKLTPLIDAGWLVPPMAKATITKLDTKGVGSRGGEFISAQLQAAVDRQHLTEAACDEIVAAGTDRRAWLCYSTGVEHAFHIRDALRRRGVSCETVTGETPLSERDAILRAFRGGQLRCLTNDSVLTTGLDVPQTDLIAVLRPTQSAGLWSQICGRGLRTAEGKTDCLILDFGQNTQRHGPLDRITGKAKGADQAPVKVCPNCQSIIFAGYGECPDCGYVFELERERAKHTARPDVTPLLSTQTSDWLAVTRVSYHKHIKPGSPPSLRVDYHCGLTRYSVWHCFEHTGYPREKACAWWRDNISASHPPSTVDQALVFLATLGPLPVDAIRVRPDGKFWRVVGFR